MIRLPKKRLIFKVLPLVFLFLLIIFVFSKNPFAFKDINFVSSDLSCVTRNELLNNLDLKSKNYFNFDTKKTEEFLKNRYFCLESITFKKSFPQSLEIITTERKAAAFLKTFQYKVPNIEFKEATPSSQEAKLIESSLENSVPSTVFLVDNFGVVIASASQDTQNLAILNYYGSELKIGDKLSDQSVEKALELKLKLNELGVQSDQIRITESAIINKGNPEIKFSLKKDFQKALISLQLILQQATIDSKQVQSIDLRFDKAVIVYSSAKK